MNPGLFKHPILFQNSVETENEIGDKVKTWSDYTTAWAMIKTLKGDEIEQATAIQGERTTRFVIRYIPGITNDMRIVFQNRIFDIITAPINDNELNKTLTIIGKEVV